MEHYRRLGLSEALRQVGMPREYSTDITYLTRFNGHELKRLVMPTEEESAAQVAAHSVTDQVPEPLLRQNQIYIEKLVFEHMLTTEEVTTRVETEFLGFDEHEDHVSVRVRPVDGGPEEVITCRYLAGCDGGRSLVRRQLGLQYAGEKADAGFLTGERNSFYLRIKNFNSLIREPSWQYWMVRPGKVATLITLDGEDEFRLTVIQGKTDTEDDLRELIDDFFGEHVEIEFIESQGWVSGFALVAEHYRRGRITLSGDAAHLFTPIGGFGMNTGVDDVVNLAWKLAAELQGWAGPHLLDSYEPERRPAAQYNSRAALALGRNLNFNLQITELLDEDSPAGAEARKEAAVLMEGQRAGYASLGVQLGTRYDDSPIIWPDGTPAPERQYDEYVPTARPGGRAPHVWLSRTQSLFDVLGPGFTLLRLGDQAPSGEALADAAARRGIPLTVVDVPMPEAHELYETDLALIRPDQHVAWRGDELPDVDELLTRVTGGLTA
jgi:2-polyprenyl-6-methoxyphenol hydroxylase-like FAD-dependent oxidoreductase